MNQGSHLHDSHVAVRGRPQLTYQSVQIPRNRTAEIPSPLSWPPGRCASAPSACRKLNHWRVDSVMLCFFQSQESKSCNSFAKGFRCSIDNYKATIQKGECAAVDCGEEDDVLNAVGPLPQTMQPKTRTKMPIKMKTVTKNKGHQLANSLVLGFQFVHCLLPIDNGSISC